MSSKTLKTLGLALAAAGALAFAPANAGDGDFVINIGRDGDLLEQLIELDQDGIEEMRAEIADARAEIADAIIEIEQARKDVEEAPAIARVVLRIAFASARAGASEAVDEALSDARREIDRAEAELRTADVSADERAETQGALDVLRTELDSLEQSLNELVETLQT